MPPSSRNIQHITRFSGKYSCSLLLIVNCRQYRQYSNVQLWLGSQILEYIFNAKCLHSCNNLWNTSKRLKHKKHEGLFWRVLYCTAEERSQSGTEPAVVCATSVEWRSWLLSYVISSPLIRTSHSQKVRTMICEWSQNVEIPYIEADGLWDSTVFHNAVHWWSCSLMTHHAVSL